MQKFRFQYQFEGKGLENNFGPSVKLSDKKNQNGRKNPIWLPIFSFFVAVPLITFVLLNINRFLVSIYICMSNWM